MLLLLLLLGYTLCVVLLGPRLVAGRAWTSTSPRLGLLVCQAVLAAMVSGVVLMSAMAAVSVQHLRADLGHLLHACAVAVWRSAQHPGVPATTLLGLSAAVLLMRLVRAAATNARTARRARCAQRTTLTLVGTSSCGKGFTLVPSELRFAYCLPGQGGRIVVSTAAERELSEAELAAVLAHERAHLTGRHHVLVQVAKALATAVPLAPMRALYAEVAQLVEMAADDRACRQVDRDDLLAALLCLGTPATRTPGLAANGSATLTRGLRLALPAPEQQLHQRLALGTAATAMVLTPWLLMTVPTVLALTGHCTS